MTYNFEIKPPDYLFSEVEQEIRPDCNIQNLTGEETVLKSQVIEDGFERILEDFTPIHDVVIFSLCAATRPYIKSLKWKKLYEYFGDVADLVVCSNGGIIPMQYMYCYPYTVYEAHRTTNKYDQLYKDTMMRRLRRFLDKFGDRYKTVIYYFSPCSRNAEAIREAGDTIPGILLPTKETYRYGLDHRTPGINNNRYPLLGKPLIEELSKAVYSNLPEPAPQVKEPYLF